MKPHIPTMLLTALLAVQATYTAKADYINGGVFYDVGKEMYSDKQNPAQDDEVCWAATGSNMVQYWQDAYKDSVDAGKTPPYGVSDNPTAYTPTGTAYLNVYKHFLNALPQDGSGNIGWYTSDFCDWFFKGKDIQAYGRTIASGGDGGFYQTAFTDMTSSTTVLDASDDFNATIKYALNDAGGSIGLQILQSPVSDSSKHTFNHQITCWGYEQSEGEITSLILCDSDDKYFGAFRVDVKREDGQIYLVTDHKTNALWGADYETDRNRVHVTTYIETPMSIYKSPKELPISTRIDDSGKVEENTRLSDSQVCSAGVTVGNNETVVVLTSDTGKKLTISADSANATGLDIAKGAMASLSSLEVAGFNEGGIITDGHLYVGDVNAAASLTVRENSTGTNGGGVQNNTFLSIAQCETVTFTENHADDGKGGAIFNKGNTYPQRPTDNTTVSIRGNKSVEFSGNTAAGGQGNDIYNGVGASLNISNNDAVFFRAAEGHAGEASIVNKGTTYLGVAWAKTLAFENAALDSRGGTTYIGRDINNTGNDAFEGFVDFLGNEGQQLSIGSYVEPAEMRNVWIDATGITGESVANSLISHVNTVASASDGHVSSAYTLQNLTLDTTSQLAASGAITLNNVDIALGEGDFGQDETFDITKLFLTNTNFNGAITFDASGLKLEELPEEMKVQLADNVIGALEDEGKLIKFITGGYEYEYLGVQEQNTMVFGNAHPVVPEPATGTLGLLAFAGLCARRRRK